MRFVLSPRATAATRKTPPPSSASASPAAASLRSYYSASLSFLPPPVPATTTTTATATTLRARAGARARARARAMSLNSTTTISKRALRLNIANTGHHHHHLYTTTSSSSSTTAVINASKMPLYRETPRLTPHSTGVPPKGKLFAHQSSLPRLPVPKLASTLPLLMRSIQATADASAGKFAASDVERVRRLAADFENSKIGPLLQSRLLDRAREIAGSTNCATNSASSWLEEWWNDWAYMSARDPLVFNVNYFFHFTDKVNGNADVPTRQAKVQAQRAALITKAAYLFFLRLQNHDLDPESAKSGPLCSHQYNYMFNTCRVPRPGSDVSHFYSPENNHHVAVVHKNQFYTFNLHHKKSNSNAALSIAEIERCLESILLDNNALAAPLGALTTLDRDSWANARAQLLESKDQNPLLLERLESALFLICLDSDQSPTTLDDCARLFWHGDGRNRYFDKSLQFIVAANGKAGFNGEHSLMDATPTGRLCEFVVSAINAPHAAESLDKQVTENLVSSVAVNSHINKFKFDNDDQLIIERLDFNTNNVIQAIRHAESAFDKLRDAHSVNVMAFRDFGKNELKRLGVSPDAFVQLAFQLAYARLHNGRIATTYETSQTRQFSHGRTEAGRSVTVESAAFVAAVIGGDKGSVGTSITSSSSSLPPPPPPPQIMQQLAELLRAAAAAHGSYMKAAGNGQGVDRHLLGLRFAVNKKNNEQVPALLDDPLVAASKYWQMSTSQLTSEYFDGYGWGQVVPDGYGLPYMIKNDSIHINIASLVGLEPKRLNKAVATALTDMRSILAAAASTSSPSSQQRSRL